MYELQHTENIDDLNNLKNLSLLLIDMQNHIKNVEICAHNNHYNV